MKFFCRHLNLTYCSGTALVATKSHHTELSYTAPPTQAHKFWEEGEEEGIHVHKGVWLCSLLYMCQGKSFCYFMSTQVANLEMQVFAHMLAVCHPYKTCSYCAVIENNWSVKVLNCLLWLPFLCTAESFPSCGQSGAEMAKLPPKSN